MVQPFAVTVGKLTAKPEPTPDNLREFEAHCQALDIDAAFAVDPDADRCVLVAGGKVVLEELTLAAAVTGFLALNPQKIVVKNVSTSLATDAAAIAHGAQVVQTAVGEVNVCLKMRELGAAIGGEGNGGVILQAAHLGRDSIVAIMLILQWMALEKKPLQGLLVSLKVYEIVKEKFEFAADQKQAIQDKLAEFAAL